MITAGSGRYSSSECLDCNTAGVTQYNSWSFYSLKKIAQGLIAQRKSFRLSRGQVARGSACLNVLYLSTTFASVKFYNGKMLG